jgi:hypothetical protein
MSRLSPKISNKLEEYQVKIELILLVAFVIGLLLKIYSGIGASILIVSLSSLAFLYWMLGNKHYAEDANKMVVFLDRLTHTASSIAAIGILFGVLKWEGTSTFLAVGFFSLLAVTVVGLIYKLKEKEDLNLLQASSIRTFALLLFSGVLFFIGTGVV